MIEKTRLSAEQLAANFADLHPPFSRDEAVVAASHCLYCYDAPCTRACPTGIDVPRFIRQILHHNPLGAAETILEENILGGSCARACPTEVLCEGACVERTLLQEPVQIGRLQRYATDHAAERGVWFFEPGEDTGKRIGIIGSGPAGLSCAHELRKMGHAVTMFEARDVPGGLNTLGIAPYKITTEFALSEVEPILEMGVDIRFGEYVGPARLREIRADYDAVFVAIGLGQTRTLELPGHDLIGVEEALDFIFPAHTGSLGDCRVGRHVAVIGAGNTAIDVATQAVRLGADSVTIVYRRGAEEMSAFAYEYDLAKTDGISFVWYAKPVAFLGRGRLEGLRVQPLAYTPDGRSQDAGPMYDLPCDMAIMALGQSPLLDEFGPLEAGIFAGGDCISGGGEIVDAVQAGKEAALDIDRYVSA